jgi:hypothetical protein
VFRISDEMSTDGRLQKCGQQAAQGLPRVGRQAFGAGKSGAAEVNGAPSPLLFCTIPLKAPVATRQQLL